MIAKNFEDEINELLDKIYDASPKERELAMEMLQAAIVASNLPFLRVVGHIAEEDPFDNFPL